MYYLAADPEDCMFSNNLKVNNGVLPSPSLIRLMDENLKNAASMYEVRHVNKEKEAAFEKVRAEDYPYRPSRMGAIYLFQDYQAAVNANEQWWENKRDLYETKIKDGSVVMIADSEWLNCLPENYKKNAHSYFQEKMTNSPLIEVVVMGVVEVSLEPLHALSRRE